MIIVFDEESAETYCDKRVPGCNTPIINEKGLEPTLIPPDVADTVVSGIIILFLSDLFTLESL